MESDYPIAVDTLAATLASLLSARGCAREVALLATSAISIHYIGEDFGTDLYRFVLQVPVQLFVSVHDEKGAIEQQLLSIVDEIQCVYSSHRINYVVLTPQPSDDPAWRDKALAWLSGSGISNQGRVRSSNVASRNCDGLLFRSMPEMNLYRALKNQGVSFAPLPVFLRGGKTYQRIEPDFVILRDGVVLIVEVDGDTVHQETPAEAHARTTMLLHEGAYLERILASQCDTVTHAEVVARDLLQVIAKLKSSRS